MKVIKLILFAIFAPFIIGCSGEKTNAVSDQLNAIINEYQEHEGYNDSIYPLGLFTAEYYKQEADFSQGLMDKLQDIDRVQLTETEGISLDLLPYVLQETIDYYKYERYLNPLLSDAGFHSSLPYMVRPLTSYKKVKNYLNKLNAIPGYVDQHLVNLREGLKKGVSQPRVIFNGYETTYNDHIVDDYSKSYFYSPFMNLPSDMSDKQKDSVIVAAKEAIEASVIPQFKKIRQFFDSEYLPGTRTSIGVSETPGGEEYYQNRINYYTTSTSYSADDIHNIGLGEVERLKAQMEEIIEEVEFEGSFPEFLSFLRSDPQFYAKTPEELLMKARDMAKRADEQLPRFFKTLPRKP
ncbi:MAG: DUF885 domain-containing protein, partial [Flavobacteriaceae bacterium]|nr:DUF885 domain-containing protein [Flavobacteriaceae bacterium]